MAKTKSFEDRMAKYQRPGDDAYLVSHWDRYSTVRYRELCGLVMALAALQPRPPGDQRRKVRLLEYGCASGALFRALDHYLGHAIDFSFVGIDVDRRALGFVRAKWPDAELHEADDLRLAEIVEETPITADVAVIISRLFGAEEDEVRRITGAWSRVAPMLCIAEHIDTAAGTEGAVLELQDGAGRPYKALCHPLGRITADAGYRESVALPASEPFKKFTGYVVAGRVSLPTRESLDVHLARARSESF